ncbi:jasmonate O-methyltransferase-like [Abrus precatorius]|uniref:Jasmonate O-methyltransferase-like n=1 Tax=Abrus precatorius TaxID=3816 RepID=A0A8B8K1R6_ABRPR|nr:jasmonate O-methyltransferase-like [Abrus precatorius]
MATARVLRMNEGTGETSYANNSFLQRKLIIKAMPILEESVKSMMSNTGFKSCWKVADLGCSSGPNSLMVVSNILNIIDKTNLSLNHEPSVLQIYLNDLFGNDFNNIIKLLPDFYQSIHQELRGDNVGCFVNATPGSFYGRLFPNDYIHFFHSSCSIQWLSQAPKDSTKIAEPLNKGNIYVTNKSPQSAHEAYLKQFEKDFTVFLESRSKELKRGGNMVLTFMGREKACEIYNPCVVIGTLLNDMVQEGLVEEEKLDFFDMPLYGPTAEEVKQVIEAEGSFTLEKLKTIKMDWDANIQEDVDDFVLGSKMRGEFISKYVRAGLEPLLSAEFGEDIMDELFSRFRNLLAQLIESETLQHTMLVVSMTKDT